MCLHAFYKNASGLDRESAAEKDLWYLDTIARGTISLQNALHSTNFGSTGRLYRLSRERMEALYLEIPVLETYFRKKLERRMEAFHKRTLENLALSAKQRYISFVKRYPDIEQQIKNYHIASYLWHNH